eukprot:1183765-Prorocentrum_minimum.AAC.4
MESKEPKERGNASVPDGSDNKLTNGGGSKVRVSVHVRWKGEEWGRIGNDVYMGGDLIETDTKALQRLRLEAQFYGLEPLINAISERLSEPVQCFKYDGGTTAGTCVTLTIA